MDSIDITPSQRKIIISLLTRYIPDVTVWAYGSRVKWTSRPESDLDLIAFSTKEQQGRISALKEAFEESSLPFRIDLLVWDDVPENIRQNILEKYVVLVEKTGKTSGVRADYCRVPLGNLVTVKGGKRLPKGDNLQTIPNTHPYIRVRDMGRRLLPETGLEYVPDDIFPKIKRYIVDENDVIISIVGTIGLVTYIDERFHKASLTENCAKLTGIDRIDATYLFYFLSSAIGQHEIQKSTVGAVQPKLPLYNIEKISVIWPERAERERVVNILDSLDTKIELNRQINQTLEQIAQAIFKSWFVDFEPVRAKIKAKEEGRDPERAAMEAIAGKGVLQYAPAEQLAAIAALFPDELVESELGEIPKGWAPGTLDDICHLNMTSWTKKNAPEEVWYVDLANTKNGIIEEIQHYSWADSPSRARRVVKPGDTIIGTVRPGNRSFALIGDIGNQLTASTGFAVLTPASDEYIEYIYIAATSDANIERLAHLADGAAYPAVLPEVVSQMECVLPDKAVIKAFSEMTHPLFNLRENNQAQAGMLAGCRDSLLPKLLSGEIELKEAS